MIRLNRAQKGDYPWLKKLLLTAFPREERPPFALLRWRCRDNVDWWVIDDRAGFFYVIRGQGLAYVFFFAIRPEHRGQGLGTAAMKRLIEMYPGANLILAIEPLDPAAPNYSERVNRKRFYERCGLRALNQRVREGAVVYELLGVNGPVDPAAYSALMDAWSFWPWRWIVPMEMVEEGIRQQGT